MRQTARQNPSPTLSRGRCLHCFSFLSLSPFASRAHSLKQSLCRAPAVSNRRSAHARVLCLSSHPPWQDREYRLRKAKEHVMHEYALVGVTELYTEFLQMLEVILPDFFSVRRCV